MRRVVGSVAGARCETRRPRRLHRTNTHAQLESFYAVPQIGAVLVPLNYRLTADDFAYLIQHSGARVVCADIDYLERVDGIRSKIQTYPLSSRSAEASRVVGLRDIDCSIAKKFERPTILETDLPDH